ncbi:hypothetical protein PRO82_001961 [Candidatus Protochlamydia amoebophila]|nr:hypothetical protein [Candidatus Protochlamydia amoebophila]
MLTISIKSTKKMANRKISQIDQAKMQALKNHQLK